MQVAVFGGSADLLATGRAPRSLDTRSQGDEERVETSNDGFLAADHQAVAAFRSPDTAAGPDVYVVEALRFQLGGAANVVAVIGIAAVDDHVVAFEQRDKGLQRRIDHCRRRHHPDGARLLQLLGKVLERRCPDRPLLYERFHSFGLEVVNDALVSSTPKAPHHVCPHTAEPDHAQFHATILR